MNFSCMVRKITIATHKTTTNNYKASLIVFDVVV